MWDETTEVHWREVGRWLATLSTPPGSASFPAHYHLLSLWVVHVEESVVTRESGDSSTWTEDCEGVQADCKLGRVGLGPGNEAICDILTQFQRYYTLCLPSLSSLPPSAGGLWLESGRKDIVRQCGQDGTTHLPCANEGEYDIAAR